MTNQIEEMSQFLASKRKQVDSEGKEIEVGPKVRWLKIWGHDGQKDPLYKEARARNEEKLARAREGGKFYGEEEDLDIEGERVL